MLCHFPELFSSKWGAALIRAFADRLLELKQFEADGWKLWETASKSHIISGAGHGMAGITGIGYEMLRYACPDQIHSLLLP